MISQGQLACKGKEACKLLCMMVCGALGGIAVKSDSQRVSGFTNLRVALSQYLREWAEWPPLIFTGPNFVDPLI